MKLTDTQRDELRRLLLLCRSELHEHHAIDATTEADTKSIDRFVYKLAREAR